MRIAIATPVLFDKSSPFNHLFKDIIGGFLDAGHEVVRFVAVRDDNEDAYKFGYNNIHYIKFKRKESGHSNIIFRYVRDTITNIRQAAKLKGCAADVLFEDVSYSSFWVVIAAKKKGMRVVAMLQDVWPDNAVQSGLIKPGGLLYRCFEHWQKIVYRKADKIICISDDMKAFIVSKGIDDSKIEVIYNWGYSDDVVNISWEENEFVKKYNLDKDVFYAVYAGNIGRMQNVESIIEAARLLSDRKDIRFLVVGNGAKRNDIIKMISDYELNNVDTMDMQPSQLATSVYSAAGVNLIPLVEGGIKSAMPSKTGIVLSCGRPVVFGFGKDCKFSDWVLSYQAGSCTDSKNYEQLKNEIIKIAMHKDEKCIGAQCLFRDRFRKQENVSKYVNLMNEIE